MADSRPLVPEHEWFEEQWRLAGFAIRADVRRLANKGQTGKDPWTINLVMGFANRELSDRWRIPRIIAGEVVLAGGGLIAYHYYAGHLVGAAAIGIPVAFALVVFRALRSRSRYRAAEIASLRASGLRNIAK